MINLHVKNAPSLNKSRPVSSINQKRSRKKTSIPSRVSTDFRSIDHLSNKYEEIDNLLVTKISKLKARHLRIRSGNSKLR